MKKFVFAAVLLMLIISGACTPSDEKIQAIVGTAIASLPTQTALPTYTPYPTYTPLPTFTPIPSNTHPLENTPPPTLPPVPIIATETPLALDENRLKVRLINEIVGTLDSQIYVMQVNSVFWNGPNLEVEATLRSLDYQQHAPDHFGLVQLMANVISNNLYAPIITPEFQLILTTYPGERNQRFVSITDDETLQKLNQNLITFGEWKDLANYGSR